MCGLVKVTSHLMFGSLYISCGFGTKPIMEWAYEERRSGIFEENYGNIV